MLSLTVSPAWSMGKRSLSAVRTLFSRMKDASFPMARGENSIRFLQSIRIFISVFLAVLRQSYAEAHDAIEALHGCGISKVVMMTGDNKTTASAVAARVGVDEYHAEVLPEDKAEFIRSEKAAGHTVIMIGDGVNDSPALSEADAGIAINTGAAIAKEIADITIASESLFEIVTLRRLSTALMARIHRNYRFIVGFNLMLIVLGVGSVIPPTTSALLHNMSTLAISLRSMTDLLPPEKDKREAVAE